MKTITKIGIAAAVVVGVGALACYGLKKLVEEGVIPRCERCDWDDDCCDECHCEGDCICGDGCPVKEVAENHDVVEQAVAETHEETQVEETVEWGAQPQEG